MENLLLMGDEAIALGAVHAGLSSGYAYPGTPSTEILQYLLDFAEKNQKPHVSWCSNEKTAYEQALGASLVGKRALVSMKHVGLNVAADPFMSSSLVAPHAGLVLVVADDPGMHSSQNEQDSRYYADFAMIPCYEPATHQQAYDMTVAAFDLSEKFHVPVMIRIVTRLAHSRAAVRVGSFRAENPLNKAPHSSSWILMPANARKQWRTHLERQKDLKDYSDTCFFNSLELTSNHHGIGVITTGIASTYYHENVKDLGYEPIHLHVGAYPFPEDKIRTLARHIKKLYVFEEGYPYLERFLRGVIPGQIEIMGKESGHLPADGELTPEIVRKALGLEVRSGIKPVDFKLPERPPQLCPGCPHVDTYGALKEALASFPQHLVTSDIGCYTLGALPPHSAIESVVCMGASIGMAKGAADAGMYPVVATIGDGTFMHSGMTNLVDAAAANADITVIIMDNETTAMTGGQPTIMPSSRFKDIVLGLGVHPDHLQVISAHRNQHQKNVEVISKELNHHGLSVIISVRECLETAKRKKKK